MCLGGAGGVADLAVVLRLGDVNDAYHSISGGLGGMILASEIHSFGMG